MLKEKTLKLKLKDWFEVARVAHLHQTRISWEPYITHPISVAKIINEELEFEWEYSKKINLIIIWLLHDVLEDSTFSFEYLRERFWDNIANSVKKLTKPKLNNFLNIEEKNELKKLNFIEKEKYFQSIKKKLKLRRNKKYFSHLIKLERNILFVKVADRIHNLRTLTLKNYSKEKIQFKIKEVEKYFLILAKKLNDNCYNLMMKEIMILKKSIQ